jgi:hypothetical protein
MTEIGALFLAGISLFFTGVAGLTQGILLICGAGLGAALAALFLSAPLEGTPRQIVLFQGLINALGGCVVAALVGVDAIAGHVVLPPAHMIDAVDRSGDLLAWAHLAVMLAALGAGTAVLPVAER